MKLFKVYKGIKRLYNIFIKRVSILRCYLVFRGNNVKYESFSSTGVPLVSVAIGGICIFGKNLRMHNGAQGNPIGCFERCTFFVDKGAKLIVGNNLGISQAAIVCHKSVEIGNNVKIGGGVKIYDTDFHALDAKVRANPLIDFTNKVTKAVSIEDNVFVGAHSIILKGVAIGENSIVGAGSVVSKSIPPNEVWAGNPAKFIRKIDQPNI